MKTFPLGQLLATPGVLRELSEHPAVSLLSLIARHARGDWGDVTATDKRANEHALRDGSRLFSVYCIAPHVRVWIITEAADDSGHRVATTVLLPEEY